MVDSANEQLAIIKGVGFGMRDVNFPVLWFNTYTSDSTAALQVLGLEEAGKIIRDAWVYDVKELEGKPCWVKVDGGRIFFLRMAKLGK